MFKFSATAFAIAAAATFATSASAATLDGDSVLLDHVGGFGPVFGTQNLIVGAGVEYSIDLAGNRFFDVDISGNLIAFNFRNANAGFGTTGFAIEFTDLDFGTGITSLGTNFTENISGFGTKTLADIVSFTSSSLFVNFQGLWEDGDRLEITLSDTTAPVPLPAGLPLLVGGLAAFGLLRRRKNAKAAL